ncbi:MAG: NHL repeat-containing protein [Cryomorphaceae bacterium]
MRILLLILSIVFGTSIAIRSQETFIYVSDAGNWNNPPWQILKYDLDGNFIGVFTEEQMAWPQDIVFLDSVALISNLNSGKINVHDKHSGDFIEVFAEGIGGPTRMKIGADSLLYVLQWSGNGKVKRYELTGNFVDDFTSIGVNQSIGLDWDSVGNLYVSSFGQDLVQRFDANGIWTDTFIDSALVGPTNIWFAENGTLFVADYNEGSIKTFDPNGTYITSLITGLSQCEGISILENGNMLIGNGGTAAVKQFASNGAFLTDLIPSSLGGLLRPNAVVLHEEVMPDSNDSLTSVPYLHQPSARISPLQGEQFYIDEEPALLSRYQVWNMRGEIVVEGRLTTQLIWDATDQPEAVYFITVELTSGEIVRQRVVKAAP